MPTTTDSTPLSARLAFDGLVMALVRGDEVDAAECVEIVVGAGRTMKDLAAAVEERAEQTQA